MCLACAGSSVSPDMPFLSFRPRHQSGAEVPHLHEVIREIGYAPLWVDKCVSLDMPGLPWVFSESRYALPQFPPPTPKRGWIKAELT